MSASHFQELTMDEHDGVLPLNVEYRAFQQMYSTLHTGIQAGLSDVVNEVFAKGLISPHTKSVADNVGIGEPSRASTLLNSMLQRTKTCPKTFIFFAEALDSITSFQYLSTDMRDNFTALEEQDAEREREFQKEAKKQEIKRQELQLQIVQKPKRLSVEPVHVAEPDSHTSPGPSVSNMRRIDMPRPPSPMVYGSMVNFNRPTGLDPNASVVSTPTAKTVRLTPDTTRQELGYVVAVAVENPGRAVVTHQKVTASYPITTRAMMPAPSQSAPFTVQHSYSDKQLPLPSKSEPSKIPLSDSDTAIPQHLSTLCVEPCTKQDGETTLEISTASVIPPTPSSPEPSIDAHIQQLDSASGLNPHPILESMRSISIESSVSSCSHDFRSLESDSEVDSEEIPQKLTNATQESESTHNNESLAVTSAKKLHRSISCEKCLKKMLRKKDKKIDDMEIDKSRVQLEHHRQQAAYESKTNKLLKESSAQQNKVYNLEYTLLQRETEINELRQHNSDLLATIAAREGENCQKLDRVKADAYDASVALRNERSKSHRCPTCNCVFTYHYNLS